MIDGNKIEKIIIIIGCHPDKIKNKKILDECIDSLSPKFDIILTSHYPIDEHFQKKINYSIYDKKNEFIDLGSILIWYKSDKVDYQLHVKQEKNNSYSVLKNLFNALNLVKDYYDSFYYIEYDCIFSEEDIGKLISIKENLQTKKASFFKREDNFLHSICFFSEIKFFLENVKNVSSLEDYLNFCKNNIKDKYPILEFFLYYQFLDKNVLDKINFINISPTQFFLKSEMDVSSILNTGFNHPIYVVNLKNEKRLFILYVNDRVSRFETEKIMSIYLDNNHLINLDIGTYKFWIEIFPLNDDFSITVNDKTNVYNKNTLYNDYLNYIEFKN